jgi:hypothetical protein
VVVHFQGKAFNPEWKITDNCWEPKTTVRQGRCGLAAFRQERNLQVHRASITVGRNAKWFPLTEKKFILSQGHWQ